MAKVLGIDLGTTTSCMAVIEDGEPGVLENSEGKRTTPSVVAFTKTGERLVGEAATLQAVNNPRNAVYSIKRFMGRTFDEVQEEIKRVPFKVVRAANGDAAVEVEVAGKPKQFSPPEISATILATLKADAEMRLREKPTQAVITTPAYFNDSQRQATKDASRIAGLEVLRSINEPTAASPAYGLGTKQDAKIALSSALEYDTSLPFITADASGPKHLSLKLTRAGMEHICGALFERTLAPVQACLKDADLAAAKIDPLVLVGGMTRTARVVETAHTLVNKPPHQGVNPFEVAAVGAAIQAGVLKGEVKDVALVDGTPPSLGIETLGGVFTKLLERNTTIPCRKSETFATRADNQPGVDIHGLQGERQFSRDGKTSGKFKLGDTPPAPRGVPQIEVGFDIDASGILHVSAKDLGTGKEQTITITASSGFSNTEIEKMPDTNRGKIELILKEVKETLKGSLVAAVKRATGTLNETWQAVSADLYQTASETTRGGQSPAGGQSATQSAAGGAAEGGRKAEGPIIDAEVVDDQKAA